MHETSAPTWCTGKTQRDRAEREAGWGMGMGNTCKSMADSCQCMTKPPQYCKVISLQLIKINEKKLKKKKTEVVSLKISLTVMSVSLGNLHLEVAKLTS